MARAVALSLFVVAAAAELKIPTIPRMLPTYSQDDLMSYLRSLGYFPVSRDGGAVSIAFDDAEKTGEQKNMDLAWGEDNTLALRAAWNSPHTDLGDLVITNTWNKLYRFAKVAIQENPGPESPTLVIMHMDQFVPEGGESVVKDVVQRSVELFKASIFAYDKFFRDVYQQAVERQKEKEA